MGDQPAIHALKERWLLQVAFVTAPLSVIFLGGHVIFTPHAMYHHWGGDFVDFWTGARLLLQGRIFEIFDPLSFRHAMRAMVPPGYFPSSLPYPPSYFPLIVWTGLMSVPTALTVWTFLGVAALLGAAWPLSRSPWVAIAILLSPAAAVSLDIGQNGLFTAALIIGGLRLVDRKPWIAGALLGLATFKPQLGLLIPVALLAAGRWRVIAGAAASAAALAGVGTLLTGTEAWILFLTRALPFQRTLLETGDVGQGLAMTPSLVIAGHSSGLPLSTALSIQAIVSLACMAAVFLWFRRVRLEKRRIGGLDILMLVTAGFLAAPYAFAYDMPVIVVALVLACADHPWLDDQVAWRWGLVLLWIAPIVMWVVGLSPVHGEGQHWYGAGALMLIAGVALIALGSRGAWPQKTGSAARKAVGEVLPDAAGLWLPGGVL